LKNRGISLFLPLSHSKSWLEGEGEEEGEDDIKLITL